MIRVLGLALYGPLAASTRYRLTQYIPGLAKIGIDLRICSLLSDEYLRRRFSGEGWPLDLMLRDGLRRFVDLLELRACRMAIVHCELFPLMPGGLERFLLRRPYLYDFDDAFYLKYESARFRGTTGWLRGKFDTVIRGAAEITAGSGVLKDYACRLNPRTHLLPTVVDTFRYTPIRRAHGTKFTVGWIGSPSTAPYLEALVQPLTQLASEAPLRLIVIGGRAPNIPGAEVHMVDWSEATEIDLIRQFDVGVMPLPDDPWARGKCAFKLIQYMACGVAVVASPVGANVEVVDGECGLLASSANEWEHALRRLRDDSKLRADAGAAGRERVVDHYSLAGNLPIMAGVLHRAAA